MKLRMMNFPLLISLLLLVLFIFPLKSEPSDDHNVLDKEEESGDYDEKGSLEDDSHEDKEDAPENESVTRSLEDDSHEDKEDAPGNDAVTTNNNATSGIDGTQAMTTVQAKPRMEMAQSGQDSQLETDVAVKVGVPVALFVLLILLGVIRLVYSGQLKDRVPEQGKIFARIPDDSIPIYVVNGLSLGKTTSEKFDNRTYAMQDWPEEQQSGNNSIAGNVYYNTDQGICLCDDASQTGKNYSGFHHYEEIDLKFPSNDRNTTYQTIDEGRACTY